VTNLSRLCSEPSSLLKLKMAPYDQKTPKWKSLILPSQPTFNMLKILNSGLMSREGLKGFQKKKSLNVSLVADIFREEMYSKKFENY